MGPSKIANRSCANKYTYCSSFLSRHSQGMGRSPRQAPMLALKIDTSRVYLSDSYIDFIFSSHQCVRDFVLTSLLMDPSLIQPT